MHNILKTMTFTAIIGSTNLLASDGVFLFTEAPDQPTQSIVYETSPTLRVNAHGYVQDDNDRFLLGWNMQGGMLHDPMNWDISRNNLGLVHYLDSMVPVQSTTFLQSNFVLPLDDGIGATSYQHQWSIIDNMGYSHDLVATFTKNAAATWFVSLGAPDALSVVRSFPGGVPIDVANPLVLNFDASNYLFDVDGGPSAPTLYIQWDPAKTTAYDSNITLDFGPIGMPTSTRQEALPFAVDQSTQDGSAPSAPVSSEVDSSGILSTIYADGSKGADFQLAYVALGMDISQTVVRPSLSPALQASVNAIFPVVAP